MDLLARATRARQRVLAVFNARQSDFESLRAWNDHLERVEELIFNLTEGVDASATESAIAEHKRRNASEIARYAARARDEGRAAMGETAEAMDADEGEGEGGSADPGLGIRYKALAMVSKGVGAPVGFVE